MLWSPSSFEVWGKRGVHGTFHQFQYRLVRSKSAADAAHGIAWLFAVLYAPKEVVIGPFEAHDHILEDMRSNVLVLWPLLFDVSQFAFLLVVANGVLSCELLTCLVIILVGMTPDGYLVGVAALLQPSVVEFSAPI